MKKSELRKIIQEEMKGYSKYAPNGETKGGTTDDFKNILTAIAKQGAEQEKEAPMKEETSDIERVDIAYTFPGNRFYSITVNGKKVSGYDAGNEVIKGLTGMDLPTRAYFDDKEVLDIVDALKAKGIQAGSSEMDVS